jgi:DNA-binding response OmpR family regulator/flagellar motor protein MotB
MRILVAEDDEALGKFVRRGLEAEHYAVDVSATGDQVRDLSQATNYDLLLLDLGLPNLDGKSVLRQVRVKKPTLPVLVLSARSRVQERVECLDLGADDFLPKPFAFAELAARIRALLRRCHTASEAVLEVGDLRLDRLGRVVERAGKKIDLTVREFALLEYLMKNAGRRITRSMIAEHVWSASFDTPTNLIDVYVAYSSSQVDKRRVGKLAMAIQVAFQDLGVFQTSTTRVPIDSSSPMPFSKVQAIEGAALTASLLGRIAPSTSDGNSSNAETTELWQELEQALGLEIAEEKVALRREPDGLVISLREIGFFESGSAHIKADSEFAFDRIAEILREKSYRLRIEGHTDNVPIHTALYASNWELSTARATVVVRLLIVRNGIAPGRLSAGGFAEFHPIATNGSLAGRAQNRRVDVVILDRDLGAPASGNLPTPLARPATR